MKANRKFIEKEAGVSAVIGVILMVAITVAIAATVYVYVSGMIGGPGQQTPQLQFIVDSTNDKITVSTASSGINWDDFSIKTDTTNATLSMNGQTAHSTGISWTEVDTANFGTSTPTNVGAGDYFTVAGANVSGNVEISLRYDPTNSLVGTWTVNV